MLKFKWYSSPEQVISELWGVTSQMESQCYLPSNTSVTHCAITPARQAGIQFTYFGWVDLSDWLSTKMVYLYADGHPPKY